MQIIMPKLGLTMTHGTITEWLKSAGDPVKAEEALCAYETEKVTLELTAPGDGVLVDIFLPAGATVPAGEPVCEFRLNGEAPRPVRRPPAAPVVATPRARQLAREWNISLAALVGSGPAGRVQASDVSAARGQASAVPVVEPPPGAITPAGPIKATPLARRMAEAEGLDLAALQGTGAEGTVTREDVEQALRAQSSKPAAVSRQAPLAGTAPITSGPAPLTGEQVIAHSMLRRTIAERMTQSAFTAPHVTLTTEAEATNLVSARTQLNQELPPEAKISYNALFAALAARALKEHPSLNARWAADGIHLLPDINVALAVDTERGLLTPVLSQVDRHSLSAIQEEYAALVRRALDGKSLPGDFAGGTFTITNLGAMEIDAFTPIINPPQAAILGVGRIVDKVVPRDGAMTIRPMVTLSLSFDHRIVDGGPAARFLQRIKQLVERPMALLL